MLSLAYLESPQGPGPHPTGSFLRFRDAVERDFARTRRVRDYARALGYSPPALSRATQAAVGMNAKRFIERRTILEAKRLLAHSDNTAAQVAHQLGFPSATNFTKYFHQGVGSTPIALRAQIRGAVDHDRTIP